MGINRQQFLVLRLGIFIAHSGDSAYTGFWWNCSFECQVGVVSAGKPEIRVLTTEEIDEHLTAISERD